MGTIKFVNDFLCEEDLNTARKIVHNLKWEFNQTSKFGGPGYVFWFSDLLEEKFFSEHVFEKIQHHFKKKYELLRVYANGQTYGLESSYHTDDESEDCYTCLIYLSDITHQNVDRYDGYTLFKRDNDIISVEPILNRCLLFNSNILHKGMCPSRLTEMLRITVAFKLREIK